MLPNYITPKRAFTLIELLVVVAIVGILSAIVSANFIESIIRADAAGSQQNLHTIHNALLSYRVDYGQFPLADCLADNKPRSDKTGWGCGPAANGFWCGVPLILVERRYCSEASLYDPALKRKYDFSIEAYPTCGDSNFSGKNVPQWKFMRYAYNSAAADSSGYDGGQNNIEEDWQADVWLARSLHVDIGQFNPDRKVDFPYRIDPVKDKPGYSWYGEFELTIHGTIRQRAVQIKPNL